MRLICIPFLFLYLIQASYAQGTLEGRILDQESGKGIADVIISIRNFPSFDTTLRSGPDGGYQFRGPQGNYRLQLLKKGYENSTSLIRIENGESKNLIITLKEEANLALDQQLITALRMPSQAIDQPEAISFLSEKQIFANNPRSMPEALMGVTGVWVQKTNHGGGSPFVRGLTGNQTLLLVDGIRLNNAGYRYGPNQYLNTVDPLSISRVEVLRGSGSVQYGTDALGGTINMISRSPQFSEDGKLRAKLGGNLKYGVAFFDGQRFDQERTTRAELKVEGKRMASLFGLSVKDFGELVAGDTLGPQPPSAYLEIDIDFKTKFKLGKSSQLTLAYQRVNQDSVGRYDQVTQLGRYELYQFDPQQRNLGYLRWEKENNHKLSSKLTVTASYQLFVEERDKRRVGANSTTFERDEIGTWGFSLVNESQKGKKWSHSSGLDVYQDQVSSETRVLLDSTGEENLGRGLYPDGSGMTNAGIFSLHSFDFEPLRLHAGLRYNFVQVSAFDETFGDLNINPQALIGNLGAVFKLNENHRLIAQVNSGFRAPNINDMTSFGSFDFGIEVPNDQLNPERSISGELGYKASTRYIQVNVSAFYTRLVDLITRTKSSFEGDTLYQGQRVFTKINEAQAFIAGLEGDFSWNILPRSPWFLSGNITYLYGQTIADNPSPLRRIPPLNGRLRLTYREGKTDASFEWMGAGMQDRLSGGDMDDHRIPEGGTPGWSILNAYFSYQFEWANFSFKAENLLNEAYRYHGSGVDGYGRSFWLGLRVDL